MAPSTAMAGLVLASLTRLFMVLIVICIFIWAFQHQPGVSFHGRQITDKTGRSRRDYQQVFTWHPLLMVLAFAVVMAEALLAWRETTLVGKRPWRKAWHAIWHTVAIVLIWLGISAEITYKNLAKNKHLATVHSWLGVLIISLATIQWLVGLLAFAALRSRQSRGKGMVLEYHRFFGFVVFLAGLAQCALGATEQTFISLTSGGINPGLIRNMGLLGLLLLGLATLVMLTLHGPHAARHPQGFPPGADHRGAANGDGIEASGYSKYSSQKGAGQPGVVV